MLLLTAVSSASAQVGNGTPSVRLLLPADTFAGSYSGGVTLGLVAGP